MTSTNAASAPRDAAATYDVVAVRYGTRKTTKSDVYLNFDLYGEADAEIEMDYYFWLVRNPQLTVLVDCGFNERSGAARSRTMLAPPTDVLRRLGVEPAAVEHLIVTHAHYDHIGNLPHFPAARILMSRREYDFWTSPLSDRHQFAHSVEQDDIGELVRAEAAGRVDFVPGDRHELAPGIEVLDVGGHTPGQLICLVATAAGQVVLAADAIHYYEEYERDWPFRHVADLPGMYAGFDRVRDLVGDDTGLLVPGHDPAVMTRFEPYPDDLKELVVRIA